VKKASISEWEKFSSFFIEKSEDIRLMAKEIIATGIKAADAVHVSCAHKWKV
jgi:hypothetical protein